MNPIEVRGKTILISGASRGIGKAMAEAFRDAGAIVYGTGRSPESISWMQTENIQGRAADISKPGTINPVIEEIITKHKKLDCLINCAGIASNTPASAFKEDEMDRIIDTNFKGVFRTCQAYYKAQKKNGGVIINVASVLGMIGVPLASIYCGTKGAVIQLTRALAVEWAASDFRINAICPGFIDTDMTVMIKERPSVLEKLTANIPLKRLGKPSDLTGAALYLASDASAYMTGQLIVLDGGLTAM